MRPASISRPAAALVEPTVVDPAFDAPDRVVELIGRGAPYKTLAAVHRDPPEMPAAPWFRNFWALGGKVLFPGAEPVFHNPRYIDAAKELFGAQVVMPLAMNGYYLYHVNGDWMPNFRFLMIAVPFLSGLGMDVRFAEARDGHNWENWRDRLREGLSWLFPGPLWLVYE